jgi:hypothetical protein
LGWRNSTRDDLPAGSTARASRLPGQAIMGQLQSIISAAKDLAAATTSVPASGSAATSAQTNVTNQTEAVQETQEYRQIFSEDDNPDGVPPATQALVDG